MSAPTDGSRGKPATRRTLLARRDALSAAERAAASARIADAVCELLAERLPAGATVALYAGKASEVETTGLDAALRARGFAIAYPRVVDDARELAFFAVTPGALEPSRFGLSEPRPDAPRVELGAIAAFVVPGVAFDRAGGRVGWGRGHYDATLAAARADALRVGLAYECQLVERVPRDPHDATMHVIVTEVATHAVA